jgi:hypothetical protein
MNRKFWMARFSLSVGTVCLFLGQGLWGQSANVTGSGTNTGCGYSLGRPTAPVQPQLRPGQTETKFRSGLLLVSNHYSGPEGDNASIVGLWKIKFLLADGSVFDDGYATWHSDGTELMNSGRAPMTGSFCMGAWKQTNDDTYRLNHFALSWDPSGTTFVGPANIRETITVDPSGKTYKGRFTLNQYDVNGNLLAHFAGRVIGLRITAD